MDFFWGFVLLGVALVVARIIRSRVALLQKLFIPSSIVAGLLLLLAGPQGVGRAFAAASPWEWGLFSEALFQVWRSLPGMLINVVFAALFLGKPIPGIRAIWLRAGPQVVFGQTLAWGQYVVGIGLCMLILTPVFGLNPLAGALIEISFEGGHGTAAGMAQTFRDLGFEEGPDLALGLATVGLVAGVLLGTVLINWAVRHRHITATTPHPKDAPLPAPGAVVDVDLLDDLRELRWEQEQATQPTDPLSIHLGVIGLAIAIGWVIRRGLLSIENALWGGPDGLQLIAYVPFFPLAMIGGVLLQLFLDGTRQGHHVNRRMMNRISGAALDFTIVAALATLSLTALGKNLGPFLALAAAGIAWNVWALLFLAPRLIPMGWFERGIGDFGQSMGVTVTGLLLMRMADPRNESGALESFGYKQLLFEPIVGGGLFTAASMPMILQFGPAFVGTLALGIVLFWLVTGYLLFGRKRAQSGSTSGMAAG